MGWVEPRLQEFRGEALRLSGARACRTSSARTRPLASEPTFGLGFRGLGFRGLGFRVEMRCSHWRPQRQHARSGCRFRVHCVQDGMDMASWFRLHATRRNRNRSAGPALEMLVGECREVASLPDDVLPVLEKSEAHQGKSSIS